MHVHDPRKRLAHCRPGARAAQAQTLCGVPARGPCCGVGARCCGVPHTAAWVPSPPAACPDLAPAAAIPLTAAHTHTASSHHRAASRATVASTASQALPERQPVVHTPREWALRAGGGCLACWVWARSTRVPWCAAQSWTRDQRCRCECNACVVWLRVLVVCVGCWCDVRGVRAEGARILREPPRQARLRAAAGMERGSSESWGRPAVCGKACV